MMVRSASQARSLGEASPSFRRQRRSRHLRAKRSTRKRGAQPTASLPIGFFNASQRKIKDRCDFTLGARDAVIEAVAQRDNEALSSRQARHQRPKRALIRRCLARFHLRRQTLSERHAIVRLRMLIETHYLLALQYQEVKHALQRQFER